MKTRLLKRLRGKAEQRFKVIFRKNLYWVYDIQLKSLYLRTSSKDIAEVNVSVLRRRYIYELLNEYIGTHHKTIL